MTAPLAGLRIFDLTRILAGPTATQLLGDLGADVIKIERPGEGDDTRRWGPPYLEGKDGPDKELSAYFMCANRNKRSLTLDIAKPEGQALARRLIGQCDVLVENFKVGNLARYGLAYDQLKGEHPRLVYCSITGFGQTGPYAPFAGYDFLAQGMGGLMSITGAPDGEPMKVGVGIADIMCGMYGVAAILAALRHRDATGKGQHIDMALLDSQVAWLVNEGMNFLTTGKVPQRLGNEHPNIVPYKVLPTADGHFILAVGNDRQFQRFCDFAGRPELGRDPLFVTNAARVANRAALYGLLPELTRKKATREWVDGLSALGVPTGPVNDIGQVFADPQIEHRGMQMTLPFEDAKDGALRLVANPIKLSETPVDYRRPPPRVGQHTDEVLGELLGVSKAEIDALKQSEVI
ncbi:MAG: CaiB/BaiF CoA transferase family protein [Kiloniellales bacterium]